MNVYYIERHIDEGNCWKMVTIENTELDAVTLMNHLGNEHPKNRYRVVKYIDYSYRSNEHD